ncbi:hypothetical protein FMH16_11705 [Vibrio vulnificus]|nr:hypothetical protein [Vibrio vulnificus]
MRLKVTVRQCAIKRISNQLLSRSHFCHGDCLKRERDCILLPCVCSPKTTSRVRRYRLIPLTEPYVRASYTAHAHFHSA